MAGEFIPGQQFVQDLGGGQFYAQTPTGSQTFGSQAEAEGWYNSQFQAPSNGTFDPSMYEYLNIQQQQLGLQAQQMAGQQAYQMAMLELQKSQYAQMAQQQKEAMALQAKAQAEQTAINVANLIGSLRGPSNAFRQQAVMSGLNQAGLSRALDAIKGVYDMPSFQAPQATPEAASLTTMERDLTSQGGGTTAPATPGLYQTSNGQRTVDQMRQELYKASGGAQEKLQADEATTVRDYAAVTGGQVSPVQMPAAPVAASGGAVNPLVPSDALSKQYTDALPDPNRIAARNFIKLPGDTQSFMLGAFEEKGYSANDVLDSVKRLLPQFTAPALGMVG